MFKHIIWDFDGTLMDTYPMMVEAFVDLLDGLGVKVPFQTVDQDIRRSVGQTMATYTQAYDLKSDAFEAYENQSYEKISQKSRLFPGAKEVCRLIEKAGGMNFIYTHRGRDVHDLLDLHDFQVFVDIVTGDQGFDRKPSPQAVDYLIKKHQLKKEEVLLVGDRILDILSGQAAGLKTVYFGQAPLEEADYHIRTLRELLPLMSLKDNLDSVRAHYDCLLENGNDPFLDPPMGVDYMNRWTGPHFIDYLDLKDDSQVLEVGLGTGRIAKRVLDRKCSHFTGLDLSFKTLERARDHLADYDHLDLVCGDILDQDWHEAFDRIYSVLTFMHIIDKGRAIEIMAKALKPGGLLLLSLDLDPSETLDMGAYQMPLFSNHPDQIKLYLSQAGLEIDIEEVLFDGQDPVALLVRGRKS